MGLRSKPWFPDVRFNDDHPGGQLAHVPAREVLSLDVLSAVDICDGCPAHIARRDNLGSAVASSGGAPAPSLPCKVDLRSKPRFPDVWSMEDLCDGSPAHVPTKFDLGSADVSSGDGPAQAIQGIAPGTACKKGLSSKTQFPGVWSKKDLSDGSPAHTPTKNGLGAADVSRGDGPAQIIQGIASGLACKKGLRSKTQFLDVWSIEDLCVGSPAHVPTRNGFGPEAVSSGDGPSQAIQGMAPGTACKEGLRSKSQFPGVWSKEDLSDGSPAHTPARNGFGSAAVSSGDGPAQALQGVAPGTARRRSGRSEIPSTTGGRPSEARGPTALAPPIGMPRRGAMASRWRTHLHEAKG